MHEASMHKCKVLTVKLFLGAKTTLEILKEEYLMVYKDSLLPFLTIRCIFSLTNKNATLNLFVPNPKK
jgi:hypothetical protein